MLAAIGRFLLRVEHRLRRDYCRRNGHAYDFEWTDICTVGRDAFYPAVWCVRCDRYVPDPRVDEEPAPEGKFVLPPPDPRLTSYVSGKDEPKHACGGCNLKDDVIAEYKRLLQIAVGWMPDNDNRREAMQWLRMNGKIRAWANEDGEEARRKRQEAEKEEMDLMADMTQEED